MLKTNSEAFKKEASAASEKSRSLQVAYSKTQATLESTSQVNFSVTYENMILKHQSTIVQFETVSSEIKFDVIVVRN